MTDTENNRRDIDRLESQVESHGEILTDLRVGILTDLRIDVGGLESEVSNVKTIVESGFKRIETSLVSNQEHENEMRQQEQRLADERHHQLHRQATEQKSYRRWVIGLVIGSTVGIVTMLVNMLVGWL